jgi:hypothetical protein
MRSIKSQFRSVTPVLLIAYLLTFLCLLVVIILSTFKNIPLDRFTKDPTAIMNAPFYTGGFSNLGIMFWSGSAVVCFLAAAYIKPIAQLKDQYKYLLVSGLITTLLALDDMYLIHEEVFPHYLDISENTVIVSYINIFLIYIIVFRNTILSTEFIILGLGFFFLGLSTIIDLLPLPMEKDTFLEDAIKLFGIISWFIYFYRLAIADVRLARHL